MAGRLCKRQPPAPLSRLSLSHSRPPGDLRIVLGGDAPAAVPDGVSTEALLAAMEPLLGAGMRTVKETARALGVPSAQQEQPSDDDGVDPFEELRATLKPGQYLARDWKGDAMIINPGDNVPGLRPL
jgi:hypothetical protein